jgi:signal transduction histidine kinase
VVVGEVSSMRVRVKVIAGFLVFVLLVLSVTGVILFAYQQLGVGNEAAEHMTNVQLGIDKLSTCMNRYFFSRDAQEVREWNAQVVFIRRELAAVPVSSEQQRALVELVRSDVMRANDTFNQVLVRLTTNGSFSVFFYGNVSPNERGAIHNATFLRLNGQVQGAASDSEQFSDALHAQVVETHQNILGLFALVLLVVGAYFLTMYLMIDRRTLRPLADLYSQMNVRRGGGQARVSRVGGEEEIVDLARSFNSMSDDLRRESREKSALEVEIEERKRVESELRESRERYQLLSHELAMSNKELEAFSYSIAHDLKAPLRSINGYSHILCEDYFSQLDESGKRYLEKINQSSEWMAELINDLLQLSKVTRGEFVFEDVNLSEVAETIVQDLRKADPGRDVDVEIQKGVVVWGDKNFLIVLMENLLDNAWKYTSKTSHPRIVFGSYTEENRVECFIRDNGAGFNQEYAGKLFKPFQRLHGVEEYPGTGVGLAISHRIITKHGGSIWAEGYVGKGATFSFSLPLHRPDKK